ncbi:hypothetical protein SJAG_00050 [Schizosaccharomyces japonicus yFS275]|uniref:Uncharacterized protein n=1 Tax=Schizosaccharomyces japonicus (strain yFS275 / FY16936) TaxID=402676 RepID=B6JUS5_SCHJY|nr:hypothetical protein SJAG_00050 [Schizosaccharomyces japonicus yFS275]EEB05058.1 hypothetical protein SJAG_00050 [Schizosaccharomyces japonicus yFS275]
MAMQCIFCMPCALSNLTFPESTTLAFARSSIDSSSLPSTCVAIRSHNSPPLADEPAISVRFSTRPQCATNSSSEFPWAVGEFPKTKKVMYQATRRTSFYRSLSVCGRAGWPALCYRHASLSLCPLLDFSPDIFLY